MPSLSEAKAQFNAGELRTVNSSKTDFQWRVICLPFIDGAGNYLGVVAIALPLSDIREAVERLLVFSTNFRKFELDAQNGSKCE